MAAITKKSTIGEVLNMNIETARFFMEIGMYTAPMQMNWLPSSTLFWANKSSE